jgi:hypothetical protein
MPTEDTTTFHSGLDVTKLLLELEVPFAPDQVRWRVTNTTNDKKRGQIVPYADPRAYTDSTGMDARLQDRDDEQHHPGKEG